MSKLVQMVVLSALFITGFACSTTTETPWEQSDDRYTQLQSFSPQTDAPPVYELNLRATGKNERTVISIVQFNYCRFCYDTEVTFVDNTGDSRSDLAEIFATGGKILVYRASETEKLFVLGDTLINAKLELLHAEVNTPTLIPQIFEQSTIYYYTF